MTREISIHGLTKDILHAELLHLTQYLRDQGYERCQLAFGWHWGMDYPPEAPWASMPVALSAVEAEVRKPEDAGLGEFGGDDVIIRVPQLDCEVQFCHHSGIHLTFSPSSPVAEMLSARWSAAGWSVAERDGASPS
jgi:hypothetical protein